jgi:Lon protease-like protein
VTQTLPLFPLGTVLFPGLVLPLHIFEDRYCQLVQDLSGRPEPSRFGVIAIKEGRETGAAGVTSLHQVGCAADVREVTEREDGRYDLITVGSDRFRLGEIDRSRPYLRADVELLPEPVGADAEAGLIVAAVLQGFRHYLEVLAERGPATIKIPDLPDEPVLLSYLVAATMIIDLRARQDLLAAPDAVSRLTAERALLARETALLSSLGSTPATDLRSSPYNPN